MTNRTYRLSRLHRLAISKRGSDDSSGAISEIFIDEERVVSMTKDSSEGMVAKVNSMLNTIGAELNKIDSDISQYDNDGELPEEAYRLDPRAEKARGYLLNAYEELYNAAMFFSHISDGTGD